jgi:ribosome-associated toxin RatA of RatAB toxin-antitoxin module
MPSVRVETLVPAADADEVFARISDFPRYAEHTGAVREIRVEPGPDGTLRSAWSVNFRNGIMVWRERDRVDPVARRITFELLSGDFAAFEGGWRVEAAGDDVTVRFDAEFDLGMPSLAAIIDPIAIEALRENIRAILRGLLGDGVAFLAENDKTEHAQVG